MSLHCVLSADISFLIDATKLKLTRWCVHNVFETIKVFPLSCCFHAGPLVGAVFCVMQQQSRECAQKKALTTSVASMSLLFVNLFCVNVASEVWKTLPCGEGQTQERSHVDGG